MFPDFIRKFIVDLENLDQMSETQMIWFSLKAEYNLARFAEHLKKANNISSKKKNRLLDELEKLSKSCKNNNREAIKSACYLKSDSPYYGVESEK